MVNLSNARDCPVCGARPVGLTFPYTTLFNGARFHYLKCCKCKSVFVDPVPDAQTFEKIYSKSSYHDQYYDGNVSAHYSDSVSLLNKHLKLSTTVLDYGCGVGSFLKACSLQGFVPVGVEFDSEAAEFASQNANCEVMSVKVFSGLSPTPRFDAIHMGDVLGHLPNPSATLTHLLGFLKPGGLLFIEGPLEVNANPVFWTARIIGTVKRLLKPTFTPNFPPTMLFRTDAQSQKAFFTRLSKGLSMVHWEVYDTGWPYASGGLIKRRIAALAVFMSGRHFSGATFGNRFKAILVKR